MIIHVYADGSKSYEYQKNDHVRVVDTIHYRDRWMCDGLYNKTVVRIEPYNSRMGYHAALLRVKYACETYGADVYGWHLEPATETLMKAKSVLEGERGRYILRHY